MTPDKARELKAKIATLKGLMTAYSTDGRTPGQPHEYGELYREIALDLEHFRYGNPNPFKSLEVFYGHVRTEELKTYAVRRKFISELYEDLLLDLQRAERNEQPSKGWTKANDALGDALASHFFFRGVAHGLLEDLVLQRLLAQHTLELGNLGPGRGELGGRHHGLAGGHRGQRALALELALLEQQAGRHALLASNK